ACSDPCIVSQSIVVTAQPIVRSGHRLLSRSNMLLIRVEGLSAGSVDFDLVLRCFVQRNIVLNIFVRLVLWEYGVSPVNFHPCPPLKSLLKAFRLPRKFPLWIGEA